MGTAPACDAGILKAAGMCMSAWLLADGWADLVQGGGGNRGPNAVSWGPSCMEALSRL